MKFRNVILIALVLLVAGFVVPAAIIADRVLEKRARTELADELAGSSDVFSELQTHRSATLASQVHVTSEEPRLKAVVASEDIEHATVYDVALELQRAMGSDLFLMLDPAGRLLADVADAEAQGFDLRSIPVVAEALDRGAGEGIVVVGEQAYQVAARMLKFGDTVVGGVAVGYSIDGRVAESIHRQTGATVVVLLDGRAIAGASVDAKVLDSAAATAATLNVDGTIAEITVAGARWMAVARPMPGYSGTHALSYVVMRSLDDALAANRELAGRLTMVAAITLAAAVLLGLWLAQTLARPLNRLVAFTKSIAAGDFEARAGDSGPVEVRALAKAMDSMARDVGASRSELRHMNASLERTVDERTRHLRLANAEIGEMLDNLQDAVLIVNAEMRIEPRCSSACSVFLGVDDIVGRDIREVIFGGDRLSVEPEALAIHNYVFENGIGESAFQWSLNAHLLLADIRYRHADDQGERERTFSLKYAPLYDEKGTVARIMIVVSDLTELLALRRGMELEQRRAGVRVDALLGLTRCSYQEALQFVDDNFVRMGRVQTALDSWTREDEREAAAAVLRELHTIKGNARALRLGMISKRVHAAEDVVHTALSTSPPGACVGVVNVSFLDRVRAEIREVDELLSTYKSVADEVIRRPDRQLGVELERVRSMIDGITASHGGPSSAKLATMLALLRAEATDQVCGLVHLFDQQRPMIEEISRQLGKQVIAQMPADDELYLSADVGAAVRDAFNHSIRNALDHGFETPEQRIAAGKPAGGTLSLSWRREGDEYRVRLVDDGGGINRDRIVELARVRGLLAADMRPAPEEVLELLFAPGFSGKSTVTELSGRGIGLAAARAALTASGVGMHIESVLAEGTTIELRIPSAFVQWVETASVPQSVNPRVVPEAA